MIWAQSCRHSASDAACNRRIVPDKRSHRDLTLYWAIEIGIPRWIPIELQRIIR